MDLNFHHECEIALEACNTKVPWIYGCMPTCLPWMEKMASLPTEIIFYLTNFFWGNDILSKAFPPVVAKFFFMYRRRITGAFSIFKQALEASKKVLPTHGCLQDASRESRRDQPTIGMLQLGDNLVMTRWMTILTVLFWSHNYSRLQNLSIRWRRVMGLLPKWLDLLPNFCTTFFLTF